MARIERHENGCWNYTGSRNEHGYGILYIGLDGDRRKRAFAHRISYQLFVGPIPDHERHEIHHTCENPSCVNPEHLQCLTRSEHARLNEQSTRDTCIHGHPRTPENVYINALGHRMCRVCGAEKAREKRRRLGLKGGTGIHNKIKTHCAHGHPFDDENTLVLSSGGRACRQCRRDAQRRMRERRKG